MPKFRNCSWRIVASDEKKRLNALGTARLMTAMSIIGCRAALAPGLYPDCGDASAEEKGRLQSQQKIRLESRR